MKKIVNSSLTYLSIVLIIAFLSSCTESKHVEPINEPVVTSSDNLRTYYTRVNGMTYMSIRAISFEGLSTVNLTKDSLEVASLKNK